MLFLVDLGLGLEPDPALQLQASVLGAAPQGWTLAESLAVGEFDRLHLDQRSCTRSPSSGPCDLDRLRCGLWWIAESTFLEESRKESAARVGRLEMRCDLGK